MEREESVERMRRKRGVEEGKWSNGTSGRAEAESKQGVRSTRVSVPDVRMYAATHGNSCNTNTRNSLCVARDEHGTSRTVNTDITLSRTSQSHRHHSLTDTTVSQTQQSHRHKRHRTNTRSFALDRAPSLYRIFKCSLVHTP